MRKRMNSLIMMLFIIFVISNPLKAQYDSDSSKYPQNQSGTNKHQDMDQTNDNSGIQSEDNLKAVVQKMHSEMKLSKLSGDSEKDFAHLMVHHHQGAVNMSQKELQDGKNPELKSIAQRILDDTKKDLAVLRQYSGDVENAAARTSDDISGKTGTSGKSSGTSGKTETGTSGTYGTGSTSDRTGTGTSGTTGRSRTDSANTSGTSGTYGSGGTYGTSGTGTTGKTGMGSTGNYGTSGSSTSGTSGLMSGVDEIIDQMNNMESTGDIDKDYAAMMILHHKESIKLSENFISNNNKGELNSLAQKIIDNSNNDIQELEKVSSR